MEASVRILFRRYSRSKFLLFHRRQRSTLFVPGRLAGEIYQIAKPVVDPVIMTEDLDRIKRSCELRGLSVDCEKTLQLVREWKVLRDEHQRLADEFRELEMKVKLGEATKQDLDGLLTSLGPTRDHVYEIEDVLMPLLKKIPNIVDPGTPEAEDTIQSVIEVDETVSGAPSHMDVRGSMLNFVDAVGPTACYLTGSLAELEFAIQGYFSDRFLGYGFHPLAGVDFCKSFIVEAVGGDPHSVQETIPIHEMRSTGQRLHLVGGASLEAMCAYLVNMNVAKDTLPARYFSVGRCYDARKYRTNSKDLFSLVQGNNLHFLTLATVESEESEFDSLSHKLIECYRQLGLPFRVVDVSAKRLSPAESRRRRLELWSPSRRGFVPAARLSKRGDFVSRRLRVSFGDEYRAEGYCSVVEGVAVETPVLIGCIAENCAGPDRTIRPPSALEGYMPP